MGRYGSKHIHELSQFSKTLNPKKCGPIDFMPKKIKNSDFFSFLYSKPLREFRRLNIKVWDRVRISKYDLPFRKVYKPKITQEVFEIVAITSGKPPTYNLKDEKDEIIYGNFYQKEFIKVILQWNRLE